MPQQFSEKFVVKRKPMGESDVIVKNRDGLNNSLDISEFAYSNSELVNFENAAVNIDNSNDVIIGPVTQFNVNGNVTIVQNGQQEDLINEKAAFEKIAANNKFENGTKLWRKLFRKKKNLTLVLFVVCSLSLFITFLLVILVMVHHNNNNSNSTYSEGYQDTSTKIIHKEGWGGRMAIRLSKAVVPVHIVVIKDTGRSFCLTTSECAEVTRKLQDECFHRKLPDISYNFLIGGDGNVYVGRGWGVGNQQSNATVDIALHGNFLYDIYYPNMINATDLLINDGISKGFIDEDYLIVCHNQTDTSASQHANHLWEVVSKWNRFDNGTFYDEF